MTESLLGHLRTCLLRIKTFFELFALILEGIGVGLGGVSLALFISGLFGNSITPSWSVTGLVCGVGIFLVGYLIERVINYKEVEKT